MSQNTLSESAIFRAAAPLAPNERAAYLDRACGENRPLRDEVESLLRAHDPEGSFLKVSAPAVTVDRPIAEGPDTQIGPYKLREQIGEGGFGVVFVAEQEKPVRRKVALKIIKPGMDTKDVIARFEAERQALALMDHPNVARVLDAGATDSGRPYFVMELVHGVPITDFCDKNKLPTRDRLLLFADVCRAVQHAHQKGIIHRDLKPPNIMVTLHDGTPVAKVIDFGVSKALSQQLTEKSIYTAYGQMIGTPSYMSPEQAEMSGLGIDTRSDIYSLGVLLYELLTGKTPIDAKRLREGGYGEMMRLIRDEEPPRPSLKISTLGDEATAIAQHRHTDPAQLRRSLRGELDWIVMKCLEKDRARRYETAVSLARDVERYLQDEPVEACPPSTSYRLRKFARKHKASLVVATAFLGLLLTGVAVSTWQRDVALKAAASEKHAKEAETTERERAEANATAARDSEQIAQQQRDAATQAQESAIQEKNNALAAQAELRNTLYASEMNQVQSAGESGQYNRVAQLLDQQQPAAGQPDLRGFEWHYWQRRLQLRRLRSVEVPQLASMPSYLQGKRSLSRGGKRLAVVFRSPGDSPSRPEQRQLLVIFDGVTGRELVAPIDPFPDQQEMGNHWLRLAMSDDGTRVAVTFDNIERSVEQLDRVSIRDGGTGSEICRLEIPGFVSGIALSADGRRIAVQYVELGKPVASQQAGVNIWDTSTGELVHELPLLPWIARHSQILLSPDGTRLLRHSVSAETANNGGRIRQIFQVVDVASGEILWKRPFSRQFNPLVPNSWSPDGKLLVVADRVVPTKPTFELWDSSTGTTLAILDKPGVIVLDESIIDFSPDSQRLAVASDTNEIYVWEMPELLPASGASPLLVAAPNLTLQTPGKEIRGLAFSADGRQLHSVAGTSIVTWDATVREDTGFGPDSLEGPFTAAISADATKVAFSGPITIGPSGPVAPQDAIAWDLAKGREACRLKTERATWDKLVFSPDGRQVARVQNTNTPQETPQIVIHDAQTGEVLNTIPVDMTQMAARSQSPTYYVFPVFRPGGRQMAALIRHYPRAQNLSGWQLMAWDLATGEQLFSAPINARNTSGTYGLHYSQDGASLVIVVHEPPEATVVLYDSTTGVQQRSISVPSSSDRDSLNVLYQMFGNLVGSDTVFWDRATGQMWRGAPRYNASNRYAISPDGSRLVLGKRPLSSHSGESEFTLWSLVSGRPLLAFKREGFVEAVSFSPDGNRLVAAFSHIGPSTLKPIQIWDATPLPEKREAKEKMP